MASRAEQLMAAQRHPEAQQQAQAALQLNPQNRRALLAMARLLGQAGREEAFSYWRKLLAQAPVRPEECQEALELALVQRRLDLAEMFLGVAWQHQPVRTETLRAAAALYDAKGDPASAAAAAQAVLDRQPWDVEIKLLLARQLLATRRSEGFQTAKRLLSDVVNSTHPLAATALSLLASLPELTADEIKACLAKLNAWASHDPAGILLAFDLQIRLEPQRRSQLLEQALSRFQRGDESQRLLVARWLLQKGENKRVLDALPQTAASASRDAFLVRADALAGLGQWSELETLLAPAEQPIDPVLVELFRARVARELKKEKQADLHWAQVHWQGSKNPEALPYVAEYAEKLGELDQAIKAYRRLTRESGTKRAAYLGLIRIANRKNDTSELRTVIREIAEQFPSDPAPRNDLAYLDLLVGQNVGAAKQTAEQLVAQYPQLPAYRTTLALAHLRSTNAPAAKTALTGLKVNWAAEAPAWQAVYAAVLGANGDSASARQVAQRLAGERLKAEEKALLVPWL